MKLVGMLDSPYVRRVAISLQLLGLKFEHESLSVFRTFDAFSRINPVVKAPTLVCDDGTVMMDSTLILEHAERLARPRSLMPDTLPEHTRALRLIGLALAAAEKNVQIVYERALRPPQAQHEPWIERVTGQMRAAYGELERELVRAPLSAEPGRIGQAAVTVATMWHFTQQSRPGLVPAAEHPALSALSAQVEQLPAFLAAPHGEGTVQTAA